MWGEAMQPCHPQCVVRVCISQYDGLPRVYDKACRTSPSMGLRGVWWWLHGVILRFLGNARLNDQSDWSSCFDLQLQNAASIWFRLVRPSSERWQRRRGPCGVNGASQDDVLLVEETQSTMPDCMIGT